MISLINNRGREGGQTKGREEVESWKLRGYSSLNVRLPLAL
jgi:hypothetical protein